MFSYLLKLVVFLITFILTVVVYILRDGQKYHPFCVLQPIPKWNEESMVLYHNTLIYCILHHFQVSRQTFNLLIRYASVGQVCNQFENLLRQTVFVLGRLSISVWKKCNTFANISRIGQRLLPPFAISIYLLTCCFFHSTSFLIKE